MSTCIFPCLWFNGNAAEAAAFYCTVFPNSRITSQNPMVVMFELDGKPFMGLNGGPQFRPNEAVSLVVNCNTQSEIDHYWQALTADGGAESQCGWLKDRFGFSWQVVPASMGSLMAEPERAGRVMQRLLKMKKLDVAALEEA